VVDDNDKIETSPECRVELPASAERRQLIKKAVYITPTVTILGILSPMSSATAQSLPLPPPPPEFLGPQDNEGF